MFFALTANGTAAKNKLINGLSCCCFFFLQLLLIFHGNRIARMRSHFFFPVICSLSFILLLAFIPTVFSILININTACALFGIGATCFLFHISRRYPAPRNREKLRWDRLRQELFRCASFNGDLEHKCR